jgi:hypothetical protein
MSDLTEVERVTMESTHARVGFLLAALKNEAIEDLKNLKKFTSDRLSQRETLFGFFTIHPIYAEEPVELRFNKYVLERLIEIREAQEKLEKGEERFDR